MNSKSDNLGYLKDQERQIFRGLCHLDPPPGLCSGPAGGLGVPPPPSPKLPSSKKLAATYFIFFGTHASRMVA